MMKDKKYKIRKKYIERIKYGWKSYKLKKRKVKPFTIDEIDETTKQEMIDLFYKEFKDLIKRVR